ncbi:NLR family CARD domain-containing protein 4-like [Diadema antillarum]|uniref:NLR family CARD domain-containing protein 4-like n=1 Tax=Diadema antillarum TaxID=105358 RepID=UPI003A8A9167
MDSVVSQQNTRSDGTYERFETITVSAEHGTEQTFVCVATGDSLNGTSTREITVLPSSEQASLTKEQVQLCKKELKEYYRVSQSKVMVDPLNFMERVELDNIYTNLSIIDQSSKRKTPITYDDLLTNNEEGYLSKRLLIQGEGGVGKTTLCAKIAWDWCQGRVLQDLDMVLLIALRDIKNATSIGGVVKTYLSHSNTATKEEIDEYISTNLSRILIIFDGFDEFDENLSKTSSSEVIRILGTEQYNSCKVIVTTRPWRTNEFMMDRILAETYTFLNVEGFNKENLSIYIRRFFRIKEKDTLAESLISFMQENDVIRSNMAPFPIYCAMLCLLWNDFSEERRRDMQKLRTFSQILGDMISFLKEHYASKICENPLNKNTLEHLKEAGRAIQEIGDIALEGLFDRNLSFSEEHFRECHDAMVTCCRVGVLTIEKDAVKRERRRDVNISSLVTSTVSFPHKLFQEYVAGKHIEYLFDNDRAKYDKVKNKLLSRPEEFRYVLYFTSASGNELGLDITKGLINCPFNNFTSDPYSDKENDSRDFCVDVAFECHTEEATKAVGERWHEHKLLSDSPEHTVSGVVFMVRYNQVVSDTTSILI